MLPPPPRPQQKAFVEQWNTETPLALKPINQVEVWANHDLATATGLLHPPSWINPPHPPPPPSESTTQLGGPKGRSCDAPVFQLSELVGWSSQPPAKLLGKGQVCKAQDPKSWGSHKDAPTPAVLNLLWGRLEKNATATLAGDRGSGWSGQARDSRAPGSAPAPRVPLPAHLCGAWAQRRAQALPAGPSPAARAARRPPAATGSDARRGSLNTASCFLPPHYGESSPGEESRGESRGEGGEQPHAAPRLPKKRRDGATSRWSPRGTCPVRTKRRSLAKKAGSRPQNK